MRKDGRLDGERVLVDLAVADDDARADRVEGDV
jgi:hypothetical protein